MPDRVDFEESKIKREKNGRFGAKPASQKEENNGNKDKPKEENTNKNATQILTNAEKKSTLYAKETISFYLKNPKTLGDTTHRQKYDDFIRHNVNVLPLGKGNFKGIDYKDGGGYRVHGDGQQLLQYHPQSRSHHGGEYYKLSNGNEGTKRYYMNGDEKDDD